MTKYQHLWSSTYFIFCLWPHLFHVFGRLLCPVLIHTHTHNTNTLTRVRGRHSSVLSKIESSDWLLKITSISPPTRWHSQIHYQRTGSESSSLRQIGHPGTKSRVGVGFLPGFFFFLCHLFLVGWHSKKLSSSCAEGKYRKRQGSRGPLSSLKCSGAVNRLGAGWRVGGEQHTLAKSPHT